MGTLMQVVDAFTWLPFLRRQPDLLPDQQRPSIFNFKMADERTFIMIKPDGVQRGLVGETNPKASKPGTIRGDYCIEVGRNICHGSDAVESAQKEISLWFKPEELTKYVPCGHPWVYE